jgi:hypothetical protein
MDDKTVRLRTYQKNIDRYEELLKTKLTEVEAQYVERLLCEERFGVAMLRFRSLSNPSRGHDLPGHGPASA